MTTAYEKFLSRVPPLGDCTPRERRALARLVDDISIPAGGRVRAVDGGVILVARGRAFVRHDHSLVAATPLRLLVVGRRELSSLLRDAPRLAASLLAASAAPPEPGARAALPALTGDYLVTYCRETRSTDQPRIETCTRNRAPALSVLHNEPEQWS